MPAALIACPDRPKSCMFNIPLSEMTFVHDHNVSPHRKFSVPSRGQVQSLTPDVATPERPRLAPCPRNARVSACFDGDGSGLDKMHVCNRLETKRCALKL